METLSDKIGDWKNWCFFPRYISLIGVKDIKESIGLILKDLNEANFNSVVIDKIFKNRLGEKLT